uniref:Palladin n=1 Tax=Sparus aurata TaxID=8175 RepID=A0A671WK91_SPAAU
MFSEASSDGELYLDSVTELESGDGDFADLTAFLSADEINHSLDLAREAFGDQVESEDPGPSNPTPQEQALQHVQSLPLPPQTTENLTTSSKLQHQTKSPYTDDNVAVEALSSHNVPLSKPVQVSSEAPSSAEKVVRHKPVQPVYKQDKPRLLHEGLELNDRAGSATEFCSRAATFIEELSSIFKGSAHLEPQVEEDSSSPDSGYLSPRSRRPVPQGSASVPSVPPSQQEQAQYSQPAMSMEPQPEGPLVVAASARYQHSGAPTSHGLSPPCFHQKLKSQEVAEGSPIRLECRVTGNPQPLVRWFCEGRELHNSPDIQIWRDGDLHTLVISEAFEDDTGRYTCVASNSLGADNTSAEVYIEGASSSDSEGEGAGSHSRSGTMPQVQKKTTSMSLTIRSASPKTHEVLPHPDLSFSLPVSVSSHFLIIIHSLGPSSHQLSLYPSSVQLLQDAQASEGQVVVLECRVRGSPPLQVRWYRQGEEILDSPDFRILQKSETFLLVIISANWQQQEQQNQEEVPPSSPPSPPLPPPPSFQELESNTTMQASTFNYARPKQFIAAQSPGGAGYVTQSSGSSGHFSSAPHSLLHSPSHPGIPAAVVRDKKTHGGIQRGARGARGVSSVTRTPRAPSDSDIQGSKDAVIQDLERKLRFKEERISNGQQRLTYEEKMARRLLGADNAATVLNSQETEEEPVTQEYKVSSFEQRLISEIEFRLERSPVEESDDDVQHDEESAAKGVAPSFDQKLKHYKVFEGMPVTFSCKVMGDPKPKVYWFKDGKQISKRSEHYRISRDADGTCYLHTAAASLDDDGNYTIMAGNPEGRVSCTGRMMVQAVNQRGRSQRSTPGHMRRPRSRSRDSGDENDNIQERHFRPHFLQAPGDLIVQEGRLCRMDCKVSGLPTPDLIWQLNGQTIRPDSAHKMLVRENGVHSLVIEPVTSRDAGIYTCIASNRAGQNSFNLELIVAAKEMHKAPSFVEKLQNTTVAEGHPVRLECRVAGVPYPQIFWKRENESFTHNTDRISMHQDNCGYLCMIIQPAMKEDAGWYTVSAKNEAGIVSSTARLDVHAQWQQPNLPKPKKVRPSTSRYAALTERGLDVKAAFFPDSSPLQPGGLVESDDL